MEILSRNDDNLNFTSSRRPPQDCVVEISSEMVRNHTYEFTRLGLEDNIVKLIVNLEKCHMLET